MLDYLTKDDLPEGVIDVVDVIGMDAFKSLVSYPVWDKNGINVNLNVFARNIILWSELKGLDPEASQGNNNMGGGFERFSMPGASSYGFGLNVKF